MMRCSYSTFTWTALAAVALALVPLSQASAVDVLLAPENTADASSLTTVVTYDGTAHAVIYPVFTENPAASGYTVNVPTNDGTLTGGNNATVKLWVMPAAAINNVFAASLEIGWDPTVLSFSDATTGDAWDHEPGAAVADGEDAAFEDVSGTATGTYKVHFASMSDDPDT